MVQIRRFEAKDRSAFREFYTRSIPGFDVRRKMEAMEWIRDHNPILDELNGHLLAFSNDRIVGCLGLMPVRFHSRGQSHQGLYGHEMLVDPSFRGMGLGSALLGETAQTERPVGGLWLNQRMYALLDRSGWSNLGGVRPLKKIYKLTNRRLLAEVAISPEALRSLVCGAKKGRDPFSGGYLVELVTRCGLEFDDFFADVAPRLGFISERSAEALNWRFVDIPYKKYLIFAVRKKELIRGYAVLRIQNVSDGVVKGMVADLLCAPDEPGALECLIWNIDAVFTQLNVSFSVCLISFPPFRKFLRRYGYFEVRSRNTDSLWVCDVNRLPDSSLAQDISHWYLTYGDSDGEMW
jgi:GNAT superfamily N-acetyltransferase